MMHISFIKKVTASALMLTAFLCQSANAVAIDKIVVFGDSLSDNGNVFALTKSLHETLPIVPVIPQEAIYYQGRFSNGPVWVENLAASLNVPLDDYAYGGAWAEPITDSKLSMPINLGMQVDFFLVKAATDFNADKHLYVIWIGGNDYIKGRDDAEFATTNTVSYIKEQIDWLRAYGAKNFLIFNLPDLSIVPAITQNGAAFTDKARTLTKLHNAKLAAMIKTEKADHPDDKLILADLTEEMDDMVLNPTKYSLTDVSDACFGGGFYAAKFANTNVNAMQQITAATHSKLDIINNSSLNEAYSMSMLAKSGAKPCANPDQYLFWDHIHPTRVMHQAISATAQQLLSTNGITG